MGMGGMSNKEQGPCTQSERSSRRSRKREREREEIKEGKREKQDPSALYGSPIGTRRGM